MSAPRRPTADELHIARQLTVYHSQRAAEAERRLNNAALGLILGLLLALLATWMLLSWAECAASGAAMCSAVITPTRRGARLRLREWLHRLHTRWLIRCAEHDLRWLQDDIAGAEAWLQAAPTILAARRAHLDSLRVRLMSAESAATARGR